MRRSVFSALLGAVTLAAIPVAANAGAVIASGHDADFHAAYLPQNYEGARHMLQRFVHYAANGKADPRILLVTGQLCGTCYGEIDSRFGISAALVPTVVAGYDAACAGGGPGFLDLDTVLAPAYLAAHYDVIIVASNFGGSLSTDEVDIVNSHANDIRKWLNDSDDRGAIFLAESDDPTDCDPVPAAMAYRVVPFLRPSTPVHRDELEVDNVLAAAGVAMGLDPTDVNGNFAHHTFDDDGKLDVVDLTPDGRILTLAYRGHIDVVPPGGSCHRNRVVDLGDAAGFAILQFAHDKDHDETGDPDESGDDADGTERLHVSDDGTATADDPTIAGDVGIAGGQKADLKKGTIKGALVVDPQARQVKSKEFVLVGGTVTQELDDAVADAKAACILLGGMTPTQTFKKIKSSTTITGVAGLNVIEVEEIALDKHDVLTLSGPETARFVINVEKKLDVKGGVLVLTGGVTALDVVWNLDGRKGGDVHLDDTTWAGTVLTLSRHVKLDRATLYGDVLSGEDIHLHKGAAVLCQTQM